MIKLIKKGEEKQSKVRKFEVGETVSFTKMIHDGRSYYDDIYIGNIIKINRLTVDIEMSNGNVYRVSKDKINN
jgi:ribosomal protein L19